MEEDPDYIEFLKIIAKPAEHLPSAEIQLERREAEQAGLLSFYIFTCTMYSCSNLVLYSC